MPSGFNTAKKARCKWVDIAKGIAITAIVLYHVEIPYSEDLKLLPIGPLLGTMWRNPVTFILGGFFLKEEKLICPRIFIWHKVKTLYKLILYFYIPAVLLHNALIDVGWYDVSMNYGGKVMAYRGLVETIKELILAILFAGREPILGAMWFVYVLFLALCGFSVICWGVRKLVKNEEQYEWWRFIIILGVCIVSCTMSNVLDMNIPRFNNTLTVIWLLYCGYMIRRKWKVEFVNKYVAIVGCLFVYHIATTTGGVGLNYNMYHDVVSLTIGSVAALYVICYVSRKIENNFLGTFLSWCGNNSFYIMALHFVGFKMGTLLLLTVGVHKSLAVLTAPAGTSLTLTLFYLMMGVAFPLVFILSFRKVKSLVLRCCVKS